MNNDQLVQRLGWKDQEEIEERMNLDCPYVKRYWNLVKELNEELQQRIDNPQRVGFCKIHQEEMTMDTNVNEPFCWTCEHGHEID